MLWKTILRSSSLRERYSSTRKEICEKSSPQRKRSAGKMILMRKRKGQAAEEDRLPALLSVRQTCYFSLGYLIHAGMTRNVITTFSSRQDTPDQHHTSCSSFAGSKFNDPCRDLLAERPVVLDKEHCGLKGEQQILELHPGEDIDKVQRLIPEKEVSSSHKDFARSTFFFCPSL